MQRYMISVDREAKVNLRDIVNRPQGNFVDAVDFLTKQKNGLPHEAVLEFPTLGVLSASLSEKEVADMRADPRIRNCVGTVVSKALQPRHLCALPENLLQTTDLGILMSSRLKNAGQARPEKGLRLE